MWQVGHDRFESLDDSVDMIVPIIVTIAITSSITLNIDNTVITLSTTNNNTMQYSGCS